MLYCTKLRNFISFDFLQKLCKICFIYYDNFECGLSVLGKMSTEIYKKNWVLLKLLVENEGVIIYDFYIIIPIKKSKGLH